MKYKIAYHKNGRLRIRFGEFAFNKYEALGLREYLMNFDYIDYVQTHHTNGSILIEYDEDYSDDVFRCLSNINREFVEQNSYPVNHELEQLNMRTTNKIAMMFVRKYAMRTLFGTPVMKLWTMARAVPFVYRAMKDLLNADVTVNVLDATSITVSIATGHYSTASNVMFLLKISSLLEEHTIHSAKLELAKSLAINVDYVWVKQDDTEVKKPISELEHSEVVVVRTGAMIPVDGVVVAGNAMINEASMTGESRSVRKYKGISCYAGTVVEDGELNIEVTAIQKDTRIHKILDMIDESQELKAQIQKNALTYANKLVPFSLLTFVGTYLATGNIQRATSVLMVDYSCAIKLFTPIAIISAMKEAAEKGIAIKSGKFLEEWANVDTVLFDKTGTLTNATPKLSKIIPVGDRTEYEVLKLAACLEEHFPHSVARAIVKEADDRNIVHEEEHAEVNYIVGHGISSTLYGDKVIIGSKHFVEYDEGIEFSDEVNSIINDQTQGYSNLFLSLGDELIAVFCIEDPPRTEAREVVSRLRDMGVDNIRMLTGDGESAAKLVAQQLGIDSYMSQVLPDQKYDMVQKLKAEGYRLAMVGDGINDSPALSAANVSVAMKDASDIAREVADITLLTSDLRDLLYLRTLSQNLMSRIYKVYGYIIAFNSSLIVGGVVGALSPDMSAMLHNLSTLGICLYGTTPVIKKQTKPNNY